MIILFFQIASNRLIKETRLNLLFWIGEDTILDFTKVPRKKCQSKWFCEEKIFPLEDLIWFDEHNSDRSILMHVAAIETSFLHDARYLELGKGISYFYSLFQQKSNKKDSYDNEKSGSVITAH